MELPASSFLMHMYNPERPDTVPKLFKQRVRWMYGFMKNAADYKRLFFDPSMEILDLHMPSGFISIIGTLFLMVFMFSPIYTFVARKVIQAKVVGLHSFFGSTSFPLIRFSLIPSLLVYLQ